MKSLIFIFIFFALSGCSIKHLIYPGGLSPYERSQMKSETAQPGTPIEKFKVAWIDPIGHNFIGDIEELLFHEGESYIVFTFKKGRLEHMAYDDERAAQDRVIATENDRRTREMWLGIGAALVNTQQESNKHRFDGIQPIGTDTIRCTSRAGAFGDVNTECR